ncbi:MAG: hypothetical protein JEY94_04330 [Melioribacteraceae bacterium]|nr:hypothetical protein [Melioribacteraceae bacterium]
MESLINLIYDKVNNLVTKKRVVDYSKIDNCILILYKNVTSRKLYLLNDTIASEERDQINNLMQKIVDEEVEKYFSL